MLKSKIHTGLIETGAQELAHRGPVLAATGSRLFDFLARPLSNWESEV